MARSGEELLTPKFTKHHPRDTSTVLTVFETFASNNMRKRTLRNLVEVYHVATINPWSDTAITFNASDEPKFRTARAPAAGPQSNSGQLSTYQGTHGRWQWIEPHL